MTYQSHTTPVLLMVHAHPDDESSLTGGTLARYSAAGARTIVITCTDGRQGDDGPGVRAGSPGHDPHGVAAQRSAELAYAAAILGVDKVITLGYPDSGTSTHPPTADASSLFARRPIRPLIERMVRLLRLEQPDVIVTYPPDGLSGHPDHIRAHVIVAAAHRNIIANHEPTPGQATSTAPWLPALYHIALSHKRMEALRRLRNGVGDESTWVPPEQIGTADACITTVIDVGAFIPQKLKALAAHASQADARGLLRLLKAASPTLLQSEDYVQVYPAPPPEVQAPQDDLFRAFGQPTSSPT